jgi:hypothetical protein
VIQDFIAASNWITKSAEQGDSSACTLLGGFYRKGTGVEEDRIRAHAWYLVAISLGDESAATERDSLVHGSFLVAPPFTDADISAGQELARKLSTEILNRKNGTNVVSQESSEWSEQVVAGIGIRLDGVPEKVNTASLNPELQRAGTNYEAHIVETSDPKCRITISRTTLQSFVTTELLEESMKGLIGPGTSFPREDYAIYHEDARIAGRDGIKYNIKRRADFDAPFATFEAFVVSKGNSFWIIFFSYEEKSIYLSDFAEKILKESSVVE